MAGAYDSEGAGSSEAILAAARAALNEQRAGGRRVVAGKPIGRRSAAVRRAAQMRQFRRVLLVVIAGLAGIGLGSLLLHAISFVLLAAMLAAMAAGVLWFGRAIPTVLPTLESLRAAPPKALVAQTQMWLEAQRPALPAPALDLVGRIGGQLDGLATQLDRLDESTPAVAQVRQLVGEQLPNLVGAYTAIPPSLRQQAHAGQSPDQQLIESLGKISTEIDSVTRQLAEGQLDALAIQTRFLDYKYGGETGETPAS